MKSIQTGGVSDEEMATLQELFRNEEKRRRQSNSYWICAIKAAHQANLPLDWHLNFEERLQGLTSQDIQKAAGYLFGGAHYTVLSHVSE